MKSNAQKHAEIAEAVWPDARVKVVEGWGQDLVAMTYCTRQRLQSEHPTLFDLLATNPDGTPTTQAKADSFDTMLAMNLNKPTKGNYDSEWFCLTDEDAPISAGIFYTPSDNPCEAIFNAAWEVVK